MLGRFLNRHALWVGFLAVLVPLGILMGFQYFWLVDLEEKSTIAAKAYMWNYLEGVSWRVEDFYREQAERSLNLPPYLMKDTPREKIVKYFSRRKPEGVKLLFAVSFADDTWGDLLVYDPLTELYGEPADVAMARAISVALAPWKTLSEKELPIQSHEVLVEEKDPDNRILLNPITDDRDVVLGVAGMVVDSRFFAEEVLQRAVAKSLPHSNKEVLITVSDPKGNVVLRRGEPNERATAITGRIPFVFSDWTISVGSLSTPEEWARSNFILNISMSAILAITLLGGLTFALRCASREIRLSRMKSDFVSNVSHELRTPLASIRVFGEFLRLGRVKDEQQSREYGEYIETESRRLTQLINNILDFAKIESEVKTYEMEPADIESVLSDTLRSLTVSLRHKGFRLNFDRPATRIPPVNIDREAIVQAVANLVDNAVKYSGKATEVSVALARDNGTVHIAVRDNGIGISEEEQARIFERFHRVSTGLIHDIKGSGLGLSIVNHIVNAHGGQVTVDSGVGTGSTFTIHLPIDPEVGNSHETQTTNRAATG